ncbi:BTAD domain-containing putative transcriptional regulator [Streptomyces racemochromogenes]|uniref:BTAD domain-containing putative transcriptional regulator n=1 Tax=Streptomyces racemochromogenes TaxID=67353 RepID=A0ABW7PB33_9ACTN
MRFSVLGSLAVWDGAGAIRPLPRPMPRALLAVLLLDANRTVPSHEVMAVLWGEKPPTTAAASLHNHVGWLRRTLGDEGAVRLNSVGQGFVLRVSEGELDCDDFERHVQRAQSALRAEEWARAAAEAQAALALWRGTPLADVPRLAEHTRVEALREHRLHAYECLFEALLQQGRLEGMSTELGVLVKEHPFRESFHRQLMLALARGNRQADALAVFQNLRRSLVDELGVEPAAAVQQAHQQILSEERLPPPAAGPVARPAAGVRTSPPPQPSLPPAQLPSPPSHFVGREEDTAELRAVLLAETGHTTVAVISGMAGVGKTGLALHLAHQLRQDFPHGQLYLNLHAATAGMDPLEPGTALSALLRGLGVPPGLVPSDTAEAAALLRSTLADQRVLLLLDDAGSASQVRPLLPAGSGCAALVTSRRPLTALGAAGHVRLKPLSARAGALLLQRVSGRTTPRAESAAADRLTELCGGLPLALRIAGARLAGRTALTVETLARRLAVQGARLDHLEIEDLSVRRSLAVAYDALLASADSVDRDAACALERLGALDLHDYGTDVTAQLMGVPANRAEQALERLAEVALLDEVSLGRYTPHDLVRDFAREMAPAPDAGHARADAAERALEWYLDSVEGCRQSLRSASAGQPDGPGPRFASAAAAVAWADGELENLVLLAEEPGCGRLGLRRTLALIECLCPYLADRGHAEKMKRLAGHAVSLARRSGEPEAEQRLLFQLAVAHYSEGKPAAALACLDEAGALFRGSGPDLAMMRLFGNRAELLAVLGRHDEARESLDRSLALRPDGLSDFHDALHLGQQGNVIAHTDPRLGLAYQHRSLGIARRLGIPALQLVALCNAGTAHLSLGEPAEALSCFEEGLRIPADGGAHWNSEREIRLGQVLALVRLDRLEEARARCTEFLASAEARGDRHATGLVHYAHGHVLQAAGRTWEAHRLWRTALESMEGTDGPVLRELRDLLTATC